MNQNNRYDAIVLGTGISGRCVTNSYITDRAFISSSSCVHPYLTYMTSGTRGQSCRPTIESREMQVGLSELWQSGH